MKLRKDKQVDWSVPENAVDALVRWATSIPSDEMICNVDTDKPYLIIGKRGGWNKPLRILLLSADTDDLASDEIKALVFEYGASIFNHEENKLFYPQPFMALPGKAWGTGVGALVGNYKRHENKLDMKQVHDAFLGLSTHDANLLAIALGLRMAASSVDGYTYAHTMEMDSTRFFVHIAREQIIAVDKKDGWG